jgi:type II secretory pathway component PulM
VREWLDRLRVLLGDLAPRERMLVAGAGGTLLLCALWLGVAMPLMSSLDAAQARVDAAENELGSAARLRTDLGEIQGLLLQVERRIREQPAVNLFTTLEQLARESAVKVDSMEPQASPAQEGYRETKIQLVLKQVTLAQTVNFLQRIENAPPLLSVKSLRIKTRPDKRELLDVNFTVSSFEAQ